MRFPSKFSTSPNPSIIAQLLSLLLHCKLSRAAGMAMASLVMLSTSAGAEVIESTLAKYTYNAVSEGETQRLIITSKVANLKISSHKTKSASASSCCAAAFPIFDYTHKDSRTIITLKRAGTNYALTVNTHEDNVVEHDERFELEVSVSDGNNTEIRTFEMKILNDDRATISVSDAVTLEGGALVFTATLDKALPSSVTVTPTFTHGTATAGDYTANTSPITFSGTKGEKKTFRVSTTQDKESEGTEQLTVGLNVSSNTPPYNYDGDGGAIAVNSGTGTIYNRDGVAVSITGPTYTVGPHPFDVTITFSESVKGFEQSDVTVSNGRVTAFSGSGANYTATIWPSASGTVTVNIPEYAATSVRGLILKKYNWAAQFSVTADLDPPSVAIYGPTAIQTGGFSVGIIFSEPVGMYGNPFNKDDVSVSNGSVTSFSGSESQYAVTILPWASGTVTVDVAENATRDAGGNGNTAATQYSVQVDLPPTPRITGPTDVQNGPFDITITFSEAVTGFDPSDMTVGNGTVTKFLNVEVSQRPLWLQSLELLTPGPRASYTATITPTATGTVTVDVPANVAEDNNENGNTAASQYSVTADLDAPTVRIRRPTDGRNSVFDVTITFSESVTGFEKSDVTVGNGTITAFSGSGASYTATIKPTATGTVTVDVPANVATDAAGNGNTAASQFSVLADLTRPTVTITGPTDAQNSAFDVTITFSENVTGFEQSDVTVGNGTITAFSGSGAPHDGEQQLLGPFFSGSGASFTATIEPAATGTVTVDVAANVAEDYNQNGNTAASQFSVQADLDAPTVSITGPTDTQKGPFDVTITFSETITGFEQSDVTVGNGTITAFSGSGASFTATIKPTATGTVTVDVPANIANDAAGNRNRAASLFSVTARITAPKALDSDKPTVSITGPTDTQKGPFDVTITFSESVTGFEQNDITVSNGTVTAFSGSGARYTATIEPTDTGTVTVDVPANIATDGAKNGNTAASQFSVQADLDEPTVSIAGPTAPQTGPFDVTFTFSEAVTGFGLNDVTTGNGAVTAFSGSGASYTATIRPAATVAAGKPTVPANVATKRIATLNVPANIATDAAGKPTATIDVPANVATDVAGNGNLPARPFAVPVSITRPTDTPGNPDTNTPPADSNRPTVTIAGPTDTQTEPFGVTITFSESVTGFELNDVTTGNGAVTAFSGSGASYTATITPQADGIVTVNVSADAATNSAGQSNEAARQFSVQVDSDHLTEEEETITRPKVTITGPTNTQTGPFDVEITFSEDVTGFEQNEVMVSNGIVTAFSGTGATYTATITPQANGLVTVDIPSDVVTNSEGNGNDPAEKFFIVMAVLMRPTVVITGPTDTQTGPFDVEITSSEPLSGFELNDITVGNGTVTAFSRAGTSHTATIVPAASGTVTVDVPANVAKGYADTGNEAARQFSVQADLDAPTVVITGPTNTQTGPFDVTITFSEAVTGFEQRDVTIGNGTATAFSGSGSSYTATITPAASGTVTVNVPANAANDDTGRGNEAASQFSVQVQADIDAPTVVITGPTNTQTGPFDVTITFSENVTGFEQRDVTIGNGTATAFSGSGNSYTTTITPAATGTVTVDISRQTSQMTAQATTTRQPASFPCKQT